MHVQLCENQVLALINQALNPWKLSLEQKGEPNTLYLESQPSDRLLLSQNKDFPNFHLAYRSTTTLCMARHAPGSLCQNLENKSATDQLFWCSAVLTAQGTQPCINNQLVILTFFVTIYIFKIKRTWMRMRGKL